jgi:hypothetical protein
MEILYGSSSRSSGLTLTKRNAPEGTPNIQYPEGPGIQVNTGSWAFVTFSWPLIWMESIDAGSIGTTSLLRNETDRADVYLIANKIDTENPVKPTRPGDCSDPNGHLYIRTAGTSSGTCVAVPSGYQAIRISYTLQRDAHGKVIKVSPLETKPLRVSKGLNGHIQVSDDAFLQKVLDCASLQGLYDIP